jgi:glutathione S-transferase
MGAIDLIDLTNDVFRAYAFWTAVTVIKMLAMSLLTGRQRFKNKVKLLQDFSSIFIILRVYKH